MCNTKFDYGPEFILRLPDGSTLRTPPHPEPCSYVRLVDPDDNEEVYWEYAEWMEDKVQAQEVMGAIIGALSTHWATGEMASVCTEGIGDLQKALIKQMVCPVCHEEADTALIDSSCMAQFSRKGDLEHIAMLTFDHKSGAMCHSCGVYATMNDWLGKSRPLPK